MSGPSTLRLCFAAMAPALTEAASARLKLQDPGTKHCDTRTVQGDYNSTCPEGDCLSSPGKNGNHEPFSLCDLKTADDRVDLTNRAHGDTVRSPPKGEGGGLNLTSGVVPSEKNKNNASISIGRLTTFTVTSKQLSSLIDGGGEDLKTNVILEGFKRMNHPYFAAKDKLESSKNHFNSSDTLRILASKVVSQSGMVNGDNGNDRKKEEEQQSMKKSCRDNGDAPVKNESDNKRIVPEQKGARLNFILPSKTSDANKTMGMCGKNKIMMATLEEQLESSLLARKTEVEKPCEDVRKECVKKQAYLERKVETLLRRLKRVKGKVVEGHTKEQLVQYVNFQHRNLQMVAKSIKSEAPCPEVLKDHFLSNEDVKNMSTAQLVKLVRDHQSNKSLPITDNSAARYRMVNTSATVMSPMLQRQALSTSEKLSFKVQSIENDLDSDATASSSGGESCDEESSPSPPPDFALPSILKRAEWKWAVDRAAIVARWTWLQAQVSDLEYKIRQQSQVHRQLRNSKGGVVLGDPPTAIDILRKLQGLKSTQECSTASEGRNNGGENSTEVSPYNISRLLSNVDKQATRLTQSLNCLSPASSTVGSPVAATKMMSPVVNNGLVDSPSSSSVTSEITETTAENSPLITSSSSFTNLSHHQQQQSSSISEFQFHSPHHLSSASDASCQAARCRPLRSYRKRKILRTIDLYKSSVKAARLSDVRCRCYPPSNPCAMCGGRYNNTLSMDADNMSFNERVALLDPSFHPVLSFPQDIPLTVHCEGFLKSGLWQNKPQAKRSRSGDSRRQKVLPLSASQPASRKIQGNNAKIPNGRANSSAPSMINFTTKIKNKYEGKTKTKNAISRTAPHKHKANKVKRKAAKLSKAMKKREEEEEEDLEALFLEQEINGPSSSSRDGLSNSASLRDSQSSSAQRRRKLDNAFDINNIEIPHSIAASTRVKQIHYKEIVTPKWRVVENSSSEDSSRLSSSDDCSNQPIDTLCKDSLVTSAASKQLEKTNGVSVSLEQHHGKTVVALVEDQEVEDLSDEVYLRRHSLPEQEERKRFRNFLQYPPTRRSRARSDAFLTAMSNSSRPGLLNNTTEGIDGDGSGSGANIITGLEDGQGESTSSTQLNKSLPILPLVNSNLEDSGDQPLPGRKRSSSSHKRERASSAGFCNEPSSAPSTDLNSIEPWSRRTFPLPEEEFVRMQCESSSSSSNCEFLHQRVGRRVAAEPSGKVYVSGSSCTDNHEDNNTMSSRQGSRAASPHPSIESLSSMGDDPADPDWITNLDDSKAKASRSYQKENVNIGDPDWTSSDNPKKGKKR